MHERIKGSAVLSWACPDRRTGVEWCAEHVRMPGTAFSKSETGEDDRFNPAMTPWVVAPLNYATSGLVRRLTFVKPVQSGGSAAGEAALCYWLVKAKGGGDVQYNWEDDIKAGEKWDKRIEKVFKATKPVMEIWPLDRSKAKQGLVLFVRRNLTVQGAFNSSNLDSDAIRFQVNEEVHNWKAGHLLKAYNRTTAFQHFENYTIFNISNASVKDDQLHKAFLSGSQRYWEDPCPGCGKFHALRIRWDKDRPDLGGLRYDSKDAKYSNGDYNYNKIEQTIRYQMPCGYELRDDPKVRFELSSRARYGEPQNPGAHVSNESCTLQAVSVHYIKWLGLIEEKHSALKSMAYGDPVPFRKYVQERECGFWDPEDTPLVGIVTLKADVKKNREGLPNRQLRAFALDRQQGVLQRGEMPHWWLVIRDVMANGDSLLCFEGRIETDENVIAILLDHGIQMHHGVADSGDDTLHVYQFCYRYGINAIKGSSSPFFAHEGGIKRIFSPEKPLAQMIGAPLKYPLATRGKIRVPDPREPMFFHYSKPGMLDRLHWLRASNEVKWEVPSDVSQEYKSHMEAWAFNPDANLWEKPKKRPDHCAVCEGYIALEMDMGGIIGQTTLERKAA